MYDNTRGIAAALLSLFALYIGMIFKLAFKLRVGPALLYAFIVPFFFGSWYAGNELLGNAIFFILAGIGLFSWVVTFVGWLRRRV